MIDDSLSSENALPWTDDGNFVEVMFAKSMSEATGCCLFLEERQIPAKVESEGSPAATCGVAVLVPADRFVEASELLAAKAQDADCVQDDLGDEEEDDVDDDFDDDDDEDDFDDDDDDDDAADPGEDIEESLDD